MQMHEDTLVKDEDMIMVNEIKNRARILDGIYAVLVSPQTLGEAVYDPYCG